MPFLHILYLIVNTAAMGIAALLIIVGPGHSIQPVNVGLMIFGMGLFNVSVYLYYQGR